MTTTDLDRKIFMEALKLWDRDEQELYGKLLESDDDVDRLLEELLDDNFQESISKDS